MRLLLGSFYNGTLFLGSGRLCHPGEGVLFFFYLQGGEMRRVLKAIATFFRGVKKGRKGRSTIYHCSKCGETGHNCATCSQKGKQKGKQKRKQKRAGR